VRRSSRQAARSHLEKKTSKALKKAPLTEINGAPETSCLQIRQSGCTLAPYPLLHRNSCNLRHCTDLKSPSRSVCSGKCNEIRSLNPKWSHQGFNGTIRECLARGCGSLISAGDARQPERRYSGN
jgi:hypothetical protein